MSDRIGTICAIHTNFALVEPLKPLYDELLSGVRVITIVDDSLLADVRAAGCLTKAVTERLVMYGLMAQQAGAGAILSCCSSVGEAVDVMANVVQVPVVKIDDRMATEAVRLGPRIGVVATLSTTLDPTSRLIERHANAAGQEIRMQRYIAQGAFDALMSGSPAEHDRLVLETIERAAKENDVIALAQGSMARLVPQLKNRVDIPVLTSPRLGVSALRELCGLAATASEVRHA
jgi:Asp/Glu/hydantoin racemase